MDKQIEALSNELNDMNKEFELLVKMNTTTQQDQTIWWKKYAELEDIYKNKEAELNSLITKKNEIKLKVNKFNIFIKTLKKSELITDFDEAIFNFNLEKAIVHKDKSITFKFYSGFETTIKAEEWFLGLFLVNSLWKFYESHLYELFFKRFKVIIIWFEERYILQMVG